MKTAALQYPRITFGVITALLWLAAIWLESGKVAATAGVFTATAIVVGIHYLMTELS